MTFTSFPYSPEITIPATDFTCRHCRFPVPAASIFSGVRNRNHCPFCLWSRHLDLFKPGDRLSACKEPMQPVGLTFKRTRSKYAPGEGELMVVHRCSGCGKISANRIAADDDTGLLLGLLKNPAGLDRASLVRMEEEGVRLLGPTETRSVQAQLHGSALILHQKELIGEPM